MNRRQAVIAAAAMGLALVAGVLIWRSTATGPPAAPAAETGASEEIVAGEGTPIRLFFPGAGGWLVEEGREVAAPAPSLEVIAAEVLAGPTGTRLYAPFPEGTTAGSVFVSKDGVAYVDLISVHQNPPSSGSRAEMLSVFSLVNSILANLPELQGVVLLWNGQQRSTFAGHLDTGRPLRNNDSLVSG